MLSFVKRLFDGKRKSRTAVRRSATRMALGDRNAAGFPKVRPPAVDIFDNEALEIDRPEDGGFDPYNTGIFNRSGSWERINKRRDS